MSESDEPQVSRRQLFADLASGLQRGILRATGLDAEEERQERPEPVEPESVEEDDEVFIRREMQRAEGHLVELHAFMDQQELLTDREEDPEPERGEPA